MIVLERYSSDGIYVRRHRDAGLTLLAAVPFVGMALVPLLPSQLTLLRAVTSAALFVASFGLVWVGLRQSSVQRLFTSDELKNAESVLLTGTHPRAGFAAYRAEVHFADGSCRVLFQHRMPEIIVRDLQRVLEVLRLPVRNAWGLPEGIEPWNAKTSHAPLSLPKELCEQAWLWPAQNQTAWTSIIATLAVCAIVGVMLVSRLQRGLSISALSWTLPLVSLSAVLFAGFAVLTSRIEFVRRGDDLVIQKLAFRRVFEERVLPLRTIRAVYSVGAGAPQHLLFVTDSDVFSVPCFGPMASRVRRALGVP